MKKRYSKKRQAIIECLKSTKEHPSAERIYNKLKPKYSDLSLGTVYRNLNELKADGDISSVCVALGKERFDGNPAPHTHAICRECGKIIDVEEISIPQEMLANAEKTTDFDIEYSKLQFIGICKDCKQGKD